ncbi:MAG: energy-coupling factor transporter transmembrane component T [Nitrospirota bacterium]
MRTSFIEKGLRHAAGVVSTGYAQWELASREGLLQGVDARIKLLFLLFFIVIVSLKREIGAELAISAFIGMLVLAARLKAGTFYKRVLFLGFFFGFLIALPSSLNIITRGEIAVPLITLSRPYDFWIYHIPQTIGLTREGLTGVALLTLRVVNSVSLSLLVLNTTPFPELVRALKVMRVPDIFLMMLSLSYKYIFLFARTVEDMYLAKRGRLAGGISGSKGREWIAGRMAFIFRKTQLRCEEVFKAMTARGLSDTVKLSGFRKLLLRDWLAGLFFLAAGCVFLAL